MLESARTPEGAKLSMIDQLIQQLRDPDPVTRRNAIRELARSKSPAALKPLAGIIQNDPDPELREYARKAGQYIRQQMQRQTRPRIEPFEKMAIDDPDLDAFSPAARYRKVLESERRVAEDRERERERANEVVRPVQQEEETSHEPEPLQTASGVALVRGRKYTVDKASQDRAKQYIDAALSLNIDGNNAKAMSNLTQAVSLNPNLINDAYFNNVASAVTGLDGDAALQKIVDRNERKRFTDSAEQEQKNRRVQAHLSEAETATWTDVAFELTLYSLIVIIGPVLATLVLTESAKNLLGTLTAASGSLPAEYESMQATLGAFSLGGLLPVGIVSGISGVLSLLLQTVLIHYSAKFFGGVGTWRHLIRVLIGFYNKWLPILFVVSYVTIAFAFFSQFSPVVLCFTLVLAGLTFYMLFKTSGKIGEAYDFGAGKGCLSLLAGVVLIGLINAGIGYLMGQALFSTFSQFPAG